MARLPLTPGFEIEILAHAGDQTTGAATLADAEGEALTFGALDPVSFSELVRDLEALRPSKSFGSRTYWSSRRSSDSSGDWQSPTCGRRRLQDRAARRDQPAPALADGQRADRARARAALAGLREGLEVIADELEVDAGRQRLEPRLVELDDRLQEARSGQNTITPTLRNSSRSTRGTIRTIA